MNFSMFSGLESFFDLLQVEVKLYSFQLICLRKTKNMFEKVLRKTTSMEFPHQILCSRELKYSGLAFART